MTRPATAAPWFAPYVDVTLTPQYPFENLTDNPSNDVVLGFVVASKSGECMPTLGDVLRPRRRRHGARPRPAHRAGCASAAAT